MHAVKVPWVGQTFALANCSDSGGKKSRIRRSKEERKSMVESYIKKYQNSNGGSFPSLNLTHKEVGGSFYTVREIVREVIQENRVLGPAKFTLEEKNEDHMSEHYPVGSISTQPLNELYVSSSGTHFVAIDNHIAGEELVNTVNDQVNGKYQKILDNGSCNNVNLVDKEYIETNSETSTAHLSYEMPYTEVEVIPTSEGKLEEAEVIVQSPASKVTPMADVIVETFPVIPAPKVKHGGDGSSDGARDLTIVLEEYEVKMVEISATGKDDIVLETVESMVIEQQSIGYVEVKSAGNDIHPVVESPSTDAAESVETEENKDIQINASSNDVSTLQTSHCNQPQIVPDASYSLNNDDKNSKSLSQVEDVDAKADMQAIQSNKGKKSTLDRINLSESWQVTPKKHETNPAMSAIKAFINAFIKFWMD